jgi:hypothetical protein
MKKEFQAAVEPWTYLLKPLDGPDRMDIVRLGIPDGNKFYYPVEKRRTKENVEAMRSAERNLDAFWSAVDSSMRTRLGSKVKSSNLWQLLSKSKILQRTPEWVDKDKPVKQQFMPLSDIYFDLELRTERTIDRTSRAARIPPEKKKKTKGVPAISAPATEAAAPTDEHLDTHVTYQLDPRALKVFRTIFYTPSPNATPGEVAWTDFLHAMVSAGFAPEKLQGSAWHFKPTKLDIERSIQFHELHPSAKIPYRHARRIGRRLTHTYRWSGDMFVPKLG